MIPFRQNMFPVCDNNSHYSVTYETLKPVMMQSPADTAAAGYGKPEIVPPPIGGVPGKIATVNGGSTTTPNICIEGGRIEFVKSPIDCGDEKQDYLKVRDTESANVLYFLKAFRKPFDLYVVCISVRAFVSPADVIELK